MNKIILLGGAKRATLVEQISELLKSIGQEVEFISIERDCSFYPISKYAEIIEGPSFQNDSFFIFFESLIRKRNALPIGCMDESLKYIAKLRGKKYQGLTIVGHDEMATGICLDKRLTEKFCNNLNIQTPRTYNPGEIMDTDLIIKPARGFGGKGIIVCRKDEFFEVPDYGSENVYQEKIDGVETTHDLYIDKHGDFVASSRDRLAVIDGEVDHCIVRQPVLEEKEIFKKIASTGLFWGPLTVQTFMTKNNDCLLIEINARLGGGVTASIAAGVPILEKYLAEAFELDFPVRPFRQLEMKRARRDFYKFIK
jgi:predicted ATP-grasp superfamily ATP-dependent carboligase